MKKALKNFGQFVWAEKYWILGAIAPIVIIEFVRAIW